VLGRKDRRRWAARERAFPDAWRTTLEETVPLYSWLPLQDREELHGHIQVLLDEKHFEGAGGFEMTERVELIVAAQAAVLLLHRETGYFPKLVSVLVYPGEYAVKEELANDDGFVEEIEEERSGESWQTGALVLSWEEIERDLADGLQNVVLHEFAHQLDAESGEMNGAPILADRDLRRRWAEAMSDAYERLVDADDRGEETFLDPYGAEDPAEFFAVVTEAFFLEPRDLEAEEPAVYAVLRDYYRQDPARW
jgi:Mlc titration factor MtfA (ptsG expression regulator)